MPANDEAVKSRVFKNRAKRTFGLKTGIDDDGRRTLARGHKLHSLAAFAHSRQSNWSPAEHRDFWIAVLPLWPGQGRQQLCKATLAWWTFVLRREGLSEQQVADALGYPLATLKHCHYMSFTHGELIYRQQVEDPVNAGWRYEDGRGGYEVEPGPPGWLPWVYRDDETEPPFSIVNLPPAIVEAARPPAALAIEKRGQRALDELWQR